MMRFTDGVLGTLGNGVIGGFLLVSVLMAQSCAAQLPEIYKVEEDWGMVIHEPDAINVSPQVTFAIMPCGAEHVDEDDQHAHNCYFQLQMNYSADENFSAGGFHVAAVENEDLVDEARSDDQIELATHHDHVTWTSVMAVVSDKLMFAVKDGHGTDWGNFGGPEYLVQMSTCPISDLGNYSYETSLDNVDVSFGANRVDSIELIRVRLYYTNGNMVTIPLNRNP
jgi:hypothetical protein